MTSPTQDYENGLGWMARALHVAGLVLVPAAIATAMPIVILCNSYVRLQELETLRWDVAFKGAWQDWLHAMPTLGPLGVGLVVVGNVTAFGIVVAGCLIASRFWNPKRVWCMMGIGLIAGLSTAHYGSYSWTFDQLIESRRGWSSVFTLTGEPTWDAWTWQYPYQVALISLLVGALIAMLPIFRPSARHYLSRGLCPKCEYDLRGKTDAGCPECGWNRPAAAAVDHKAIDRQAAERKPGD